MKSIALALLITVITAVQLSAFDLTRITLVSNIQEYRLPNGLRVIIKEENAIPLVGFSVTYKIGFRDEDTNGRTGMTHLLEHMMFKGTSNLGKGEIAKTLVDIGAQFNAFTSYDKTCYWEIVPRAGLETCIKLEADRMVNSLFDKTEFDLEKNVVLSELTKYEANPEMKLDRAYARAAFGSHPFAALFGTIDDMKNADRDFVYNQLYRRYYVPNNAYIVIVGNIKAFEALELVRRYFGPIKAGTNVPKDTVAPWPVTNGLRVQVEGESSEDFGRVVYNLPKWDVKDPDFLTLSFASWSGLLGGFEYDARIDGGIAEFRFTREPVYPLETLDTNYIAQNLEMYKEMYFNRESLDYDTIQSIMMNLVYLERFTGYREFDTISRFYASLTPDMVVQTLTKYLDKNRANIAFFKAVKRDMRQKPSGMSQTHEDFSAGVSHDDLENPTPDALTRQRAYGKSLFAELKGSLSNYLADVKEIQLPNGVRLVYKPFRLNQKLSIYTGVHAGSLFQDKPFIADITRYLVFEGGPQSKLQNELTKRGMSARSSSDMNFASFTMDLPADFFDPAVNLLALALTNRAFMPLVMEEQKFNTSEWVRKRRQEPTLDGQASLLFDRMVYGNAGEGLDALAQPGDITGLLLKDASVFYNQCYRPENTVIVVVGNVDWERVKKRFTESLGNWQPVPLKEKPRRAPLVQVQSTRWERVTVPGQQSVVLMGAPTVAYTDITNYTALSLANNIFGGGELSSRLMRSVRDRYGLTYGIYSYAAPYGNETLYRLYMQVAPENVAKAVTIFNQELTNYVAEGPTEMEILKFKNDYLYYFLFQYENGAKIASRLLYLLMRRGSYAFDYELLNLIEGFTKDDLMRALRTYMPKDFFIAVAGE